MIPPVQGYFTCVVFGIRPVMKKIRISHLAIEDAGKLTNPSLIHGYPRFISFSESKNAQIASTNENPTLLIVVSPGVSSFSEPMDAEKAPTKLQTVFESLLLERRLVVEAQRETQPHEEVTPQKLKQKVECVIRQREHQAQERLQHQMCVKDKLEEVMQEQDEMQRKLQLWDKELRHEGNGQYDEAAPVAAAVDQHWRD